MISHLKNIFSTCVDWIFPPRKSERITTTLTTQNILSFPKAHDNLPDNTYALFSYKDPLVTSLIWEIKYHKNTTALSLVIPFLADMIHAEYAEKRLFTQWSRCFLVPVPSTEKHKKERGYSHTEYICEQLAPLLPQEITYAPHLLTKIKDTPSQHKLKNRSLRLHNLQHTQRATQHLDRHTAVILIDDVTTTGATLDESRRALKEAGATDIFAFTIAH